MTPLSRTDQFATGRSYRVELMTWAVGHVLECAEGFYEYAYLVDDIEDTSALRQDQEREATLAFERAAAYAGEPGRFPDRPWPLREYSDHEVPAGLEKFADEG